MEKNKVDMFLMTNARHFPTEQVMMIKDRLEKLEDDRFALLQSVNYKDTTTSLLLGILLGADRIYLGEVGIGILKMISMVLVIGLIWWLIYLFSVTRRTHEYNLQQFNKLSMVL